MLNKDFISSSLPVLSPADTVLRAQQLMADYHLVQLPVVNNDVYLGLIHEDDLLNEAEDQHLSALEARMLRLAAHANNYYGEALRLCCEHGLSLVPVVEKEREWVGAIAAADLLKYLGKITGAEDPGGVVILQLDRADFSFSEICKLVETNDAQITQLNTWYDAQQQSLYVALKINKFEISDIVATFQRYEYTVKHYFGEELYENELRSNYDHLMNYLNM